MIALIQTAINYTKVAAALTAVIILVVISAISFWLYQQLKSNP